MAEKKALRTYASSETQDQPAHPRSLVRIFAVPLNNIGDVQEIGLTAKIFIRRVPMQIGLGLRLRLCPKGLFVSPNVNAYICGPSTYCVVYYT